MSQPILIAHRGASGNRPEHTLIAYEVAARMGADYLEVDLVATADGHLVARHENEISETTDVADHPEFAARRRTAVVDGTQVTGWFTEDLTLAELRTLRCRERLPHLRPDNTAYDGQFVVPTLEEILELRRTLSDELGRELGVYLETKHPSYFREIGRGLDQPLIATLTSAGLNRPEAPVYVQSFELSDLVALRRDRGARVALVLLAERSGAPYDVLAAGDPRTYADLLSPDGLAGLARWVDAIGPHKDLVISRSATGALAQPTTLVEHSHAVGLQVHAWTFRREKEFLPTDLQSPSGFGDVVTEIRAYLAAGIDGFFTDNPDLGNAARTTDGARTGDGSSP